MSLDTPRSSAGYTTPRTFNEIFGNQQVFQDDHADVYSCDGDDSSPRSCCGSDVVNNDKEINLKILCRLVNSCTDCTECEKKTMFRLSILEAKFSEELTSRQRQMLLMVEYEKKVKDWFSEKNSLIEKLQAEKANAGTEKNSCTEDLKAVTKQLSELQNSFNDLSEKYERAKSTIQILNYNVETLKNSLQQHEGCIQQKHAQFQQLKEHAIDRLNQANVQLGLAEQNFATEYSKLQQDMKNREDRIQLFVSQLEQKNRENAELLCICDYLLQAFKNSKDATLDEWINNHLTARLNELHININQ